MPASFERLREQFDTIVFVRLFPSVIAANRSWEAVNFAVTVLTLKLLLLGFRL